MWAQGRHSRACRMDIFMNMNTAEGASACSGSFSSCCRYSLQHALWAPQFPPRFLSCWQHTALLGNLGSPLTRWMLDPLFFFCNKNDSLLSLTTDSLWISSFPFWYWSCWVLLLFLICKHPPPHLFFFMSLEPRLLDSFLFWTFWRWSVFYLNCLIYLCYIRVYFFLIHLFVVVHIHDVCGGVSAGDTMHLWRSEGSSVESGLLFLLTWILGIELGLSNLSPKYSTSADLSIQPVPQSFSFSAYHIFFTF